jgi:fatty acid desaturase
MITTPSEPSEAAAVLSADTTDSLAGAQATTDARPKGYDGSPAAYARLRRSVIDARLLDRRYGYYLLRFLSAFALVAGAVALLFVLPEGWGWTAFAAIALGITITQLGIIGHDAGHMAVFRRERPNWLLGQFCLSFLLGVSFWFWRDRHNRHHVLTNDEGEDPDLELGGLFTLNEDEARAQRGLRRWLTRYQSLLFVPLVMLTLDMAFRSEGWRFTLRELRGPRRAVEALLLTLSIALWMSPHLFLGWRWLAIYIGTQWVINLYLGLVFAPNHKGMPTWATGVKLTFLERQVLSSCNVRPGAASDYFYCGLNYQIEHHLFPNMPRANFSRAREIVRPFCAARGLPYEDLSVVGAYRQALGALHEVGQATRTTAPA